MMSLSLEELAPLLELMMVIHRHILAGGTIAKCGTCSRELHEAETQNKRIANARSHQLSKMKVAMKTAGAQ